MARTNSTINNLRESDRSIHDWYRFVLSFPPHLVRDYVERLDLDETDAILDPFCGTGTTMVEAKKLGISGIGTEAVPVAHLAASTKTDWSPDPDALRAHGTLIASTALERLAGAGIDDAQTEDSDPPELRMLDDDAMKLLVKGSLSPLPMHKALVLLDAMSEHFDARFSNHERVAFASSIVRSSSNLRFGPEVGVGKKKADAAVVGPWLDGVHQMADDLDMHRSQPRAQYRIHRADARVLHQVLSPSSVSAVITSPPYPNEKDYTRTVRLESVLLGYLRQRTDLREMKTELLRSNTRGVYKHDTDDEAISHNKEIQRVADQIEARRIEMGKTSGFERLYARATRLYFGGMARHFESLSRVLRPGARLAYVVGDQASYLRVMIRTGQLLADVAESVGYQVDGIDLFRTRMATATGEQLREEVLLLTWKG